MKPRLILLLLGHRPGSTARTWCEAVAGTGVNRTRERTV